MRQYNMTLKNQTELTRGIKSKLEIPASSFKHMKGQEKAMKSVTDEIHTDMIIDHQNTSMRIYTGAHIPLNGLP